MKSRFLGPLGHSTARSDGAHQRLALADAILSARPGDRFPRSLRTRPHLCGWIPILAGLFAGLAVSSSFAQSSVPNPDAWVTNGVVRAIAQSGGTTYIGGDFTYVGPNTGYGVPLSVAAGQPVATYPKVNGGVRASVSDGSGGWYIGGQFTQVGTTPRNNIAHILSDGTVDPAWNPNANSSVLTLALSGTTLYAGGYFWGIGGQSRSSIAALDASTGNATAWNPGANGYLNALAVSGTTVYAGGVFTSIGGQTRNRIAALDATINTNNATSWDPNANNVVYALAVSGTTVYAAGGFWTIGGQTRRQIAALDVSTGLATAWDPNANGADVYALAVSGTTVYVGGNIATIGGQTRSRIAALDALTGLATAWNPNANGGIATLAVSGTTVYAGGTFTSIGGQMRNRIAALDATSDTNNATAWNPNANGGVSTLAVSGMAVYAGGFFKSIGGQTRNRVAALDATGALTAWDPNADGSVYSLAVSGTTVYAGGAFTSVGGQTRNRIAALDASIDANNATAWDPNASGPVQALAVSGTTVYAGGGFTTIGGQPRVYIAALDAATSTNSATTWDPNADSWVYALAVSGTTVYAGGGFTNIGGQPRIRIAALDTSTGLATAWDPNADNTVQALVVSGTTIYAGGWFTTIGGQTRNRIAALAAMIDTNNATAWNPDANAYIYALAVSGTTVYAGGGFTTIGGQTRNRIAALDARLDTNNATVWNPNANGDVNALAVSGTAVHVGGAFATIGGNSQPYYAQFGLPPSAPTNPGADSITPTAIRWTWSDTSPSETGFKVWADAGNTTPTDLQTTTAAGATSWTMPMLQPNTQHTFQVAATNLIGDSAKTANFTTWTLAAVPVAPTVNNPTSASLDVVVGVGDGNPAGTEYAIMISPAVGGDAWVQASGSPGATEAWQTAAAWGTKTVTGLGEFRSYSFGLKARNGANVETVTVTGTGASGQTTYAPRTLTYSAGPNGLVGGTTPQSVAYGADGGQVSAIPSSGYHFVQWSDASTANPRTDLNVTTNITVTASFAINQYTLTYMAGANGSISGMSPQTVNHGTDGTEVTAVPAIGYHFTQWSDGMLIASRTDTNMMANLSVTASFAINWYPVVFQTDGTPGATLEGAASQTVAHGSDATTVTAIAPVGRHFVAWTVLGADFATSNPLILRNVTEATTVTASFAINQYTLTYTAGPNGSISGMSPQTVNHGADGQQVSAVPNTGYHFVQWSDSVMAPARTDLAVTGDISVTAIFAPIQPPPPATLTVF